MTLISITLLNTSLQLSCKPEEEAHVREMARLFSERTHQITGRGESGAGGSLPSKASDAMLFATTALMMEHEIFTLKQSASMGLSTGSETPLSGPLEASPDPTMSDPVTVSPTPVSAIATTAAEHETAVSAAIDAIAEYVEALADKFGHYSDSE